MQPVTLDQDGLELTEICLSLSQDQLSLKDWVRAGGISRPLSEVKEVEEKLGTEEEQRGSLRTLRMNSIDKPYPRSQVEALHTGEPALDLLEEEGVMVLARLCVSTPYSSANSLPPRPSYSQPTSHENRSLAKESTEPTLSSLHKL